MSPQMSAADSDAGGGGKGAESGGTAGAEVGEAGGVRFVDSPVDSPVGGQRPDGTGCSEASDREWTNNAIREMDKMREGIERRNSANETNGFNAMSSSSEVSHLAHFRTLYLAYSKNGTTMVERIALGRLSHSVALKRNRSP